MIEAALDEAGADPAKSMMIGDTSFDMAMAKAAGVAAVGVSWGYHSEQELIAAGADYIAHRALDVTDFVKAFA
jgi:phosphoglycolate phosphatase